MRIHTFGDSHSSHGWVHLAESKAVPVEVVVHHLGPKLMYTFGKEKQGLLNLKNYEIQDGDAVVFCFGEIDCRCHVSKFDKDPGGYFEVIDKLVHEYIIAVEEIVGQLAPRRIKTCIYNVVPTVEVGKSQKFNNPDFPLLGTDEQRKLYVSTMNQLLKVACDSRGITFIDIFEHYVDSQGFMSPFPIGDGTVHIREAAPLADFLNKHVVPEVSTTVYGKIYGKEFNLPEIYQPIFGQEGSTPTARDSKSRVDSILLADRIYNDSLIMNGSICDFGSNLGHFCFSMEKKGILGPVTGVESGEGWLSAARHIANSINSKCSFVNHLVQADTFLFLSVTHHLMKDSTYENMQGIFDNIVSAGTKTIYVEQATHLEFPDWAKKLWSPGNIYLHFMRKLDSVTHGNYNIRLVAMDRNERLNTVRPIYQLKRKITEEIEVNGKVYTAYDKWSFPFIGVDATEPSRIYYYAKDAGGDDFFIKKETGNYITGRSFPPVKKIEGLLFSDILRLGILGFYNSGKIKEQLKELKREANILDDLRPWNIIIDEASNLHVIDIGDFGGLEFLEACNLSSCSIMSCLSS
jgi:hypothetical protein